MIRKCILSLAALVLVASPALAGGDHAHGHAKHAKHAKVGEMAPDFTLVDHAGNEHKLSDYKGKTVVLEWTNPSCPFVQRHYNAETMTTLAKANPEVVWLAIDSSHFVTAEPATAWAKEQALSYPILMDPSGKVGRMYSAKTTPHMFVVNAEGMLAYDGAIDDDPRGKAEAPKNLVAAALADLAAGKAVTNASTKPYGCSVKYGQSKKAVGGAR